MMVRISVSKTGLTASSTVLLLADEEAGLVVVCEIVDEDEGVGEIEQLGALSIGVIDNGAVKKQRIAAVAAA